MNKQVRTPKLLLHAFKIALGSSMAIYLAEMIHLEYAISAGSIALLTIVTTKWETVRLSMFRVLSFIVAVLLAWVAFAHLGSEWIAYGVFIFLIVVIGHVLDWKATVSVNAVIGTHFLMTKDFGFDFILNEFMLVVIGITVAIIVNLFHNNQSQKRRIVENMRYTEDRLGMILGELATYLTREEMQQNVWDDICIMEQKLHGFIGDAYEYQNNTFQSHPAYYIDYFEMRMNQLTILHNLHYEIKKIRHIPKQAHIIADYILYLTNYVKEMNVPTEQIERLEQIFADMKKEPLPVTREEFESRALLYHILMDIEEFLVFKKRFVNELDEKQKERYWGNERNENCK